MQALLLERAVTDREHLVEQEHLGIEMRGDRNARRTYMPDEYRLTGMSMNSPTPENSTISSYRSLTSRRLIPRMAPFRKTLSRPESSGGSLFPPREGC